MDASGVRTDPSSDIRLPLISSLTSNDQLNLNVSSAKSRSWAILVA
jgi:hypothetical protein